MTFTVTYRGADGALVTEAVEAASRGECFAQMKARGVVPMGVKEGNFAGSHRKSIRPVTSMASKKHSTVLIIAALVAILGISIWWYFAGRAERVTQPEDDGPKKAALAKEVKLKAASAAKTVSGTNAIAAAQVSPPRTGAAEMDSAPAADSPAPVATSNRVIVVENDATDPNHKSDFSTGVEQVMGWIFTTELGDSPPPLPDLSAAERKRIVEILLAKNPVEEGDSERSVEAKEMVSAAKRELMQYLKQGGDMDDFLAFYRNELVKAQEAREDAKRLVREVAREGDDDMTVQFLKEVNGKLAERGIKAVELPVKVKRRIEAADATTSKTKEEKKL